MNLGNARCRTFQTTSYRLRLALTVAPLAFALACNARDEGAADTKVPAHTDTMRVREAFVTPIDIRANVDGLAIYHGRDSSHWLIATAKAADVLIVYDATTGRELRRVGGSGRGAGQLERPNGILTLGDSLVLVVERDNARVQAFRLPSFESLGTFGERLLRVPYGIAAYRDSTGYIVYVTDNYETVLKRVPPLRELGARVKQFRVAVVNGTLRTEHLRSFGDTTEEGALRVVESIQVDPFMEGGRLLIAEELVADSHIKVYSLDGRYLGLRMGRGAFPQQAEGIALYACGDTAGYWVATDQGRRVNVFHLFDRRTLRHVASFSGLVTNTTDGVTLTQRAFPGFPAGAFFGSHADAGVAAFSWADVAHATGARADCQPRGTGLVPPSSPQ